MPHEKLTKLETLENTCRKSTTKQDGIISHRRGVMTGYIWRGWLLTIEPRCASPVRGERVTSHASCCTPILQEESTEGRGKKRKNIKATQKTINTKPNHNNTLTLYSAVMINIFIIGVLHYLFVLFSMGQIPFLSWVAKCLFFISIGLEVTEYKITAAAVLIKASFNH